MRRGIVDRALAVSAFLVAAAVMAEAAGTYTYGLAEIWIPKSERPLDVYKYACQENVVPRFIAELKKQNPEMDEKQLAARIAIRTNDKKNTVIAYVLAMDEKSAVENAGKIAKMVVDGLVAMEESERRQGLGHVKEEQRKLTQEIEALRQDAASLQRSKGIFDPRREMDSLLSRLSSYENELAETELRKVELEAQQELFSKKIAQVRDAAQGERIAPLQQRAEKLATDLELMLTSYGGDHPKVMALRKRISEAERDMAGAMEKFGETGGLGLVRIAAERSLECEAQMAAISVRSRLFRHRIEELRGEIAEKWSLVAEIGRVQERIEGLKRQLEGLFEREKAIRGEMGVQRRPEIVTVEAVEHLPEQAVTYSVIGEVKNAGSREPMVRTTVLSAIASAGGFTDYANENAVVVLRYAKNRVERHHIDVKAILTGEAADDFFMEPGDIVWVPRKTVLR